ncbi:MAG: hypothetical protein NDI61_01965 [Bdellovibrionaceae bacterium]|nr:hypothetical protein [Pseudobdellovibrionaceae bacterium]
MVNPLFFISLILFSSTSLAQDVCSQAAQRVLNTVREITQSLQTTREMGVECVDQEIVDVVLEPYRLQSVAMNLCAEEPGCVDFLKSEAVRVSRLPAEKFESMSTMELWSEIIKHSGLSRIRPPMLSDLPLTKSPSDIFEKLRQARLSNRQLNKNENLKFTCSAVAAIIGPGKAKLLSAAKQVSKIYKIQHSKEVTKLIEKNRLPENVKNKFFKWVSEVEEKGLEEVRKIGGYHDEPLRSMANRRSVRVSDGYRACYESVVENGVTILKVITISNDHHDSGYCR